MSDAFVPWDQRVGELDLAPGSTLLVASDVTRMAYLASERRVRFDPAKFLDALLAALGPSGTLLVPTFHWDFLDHKPFDMRKSIPRTGALAKAALRHPAFARTWHPIHSFAVAGQHKDLVAGLRNRSSFGPDSPFAFLRREAGKMLLLDVDFQHSFTYVHHVEEREHAWYRRAARYTAAYTSEAGETRTETFLMHTLRPGFYTRVNPLGEHLQRIGLAHARSMGDIHGTLVELAPAYEEIRRDLWHNGGRLIHVFDPQRLLTERLVPAVMRRVRRRSQQA